MAEKITCPDCGFEFDIGEGYKKHLKALEVKTRADVEKKNKAAFEIKLRQEKKKVSVESEAKVKAEKEKTDKFQKELNWPEMWTVKDAISRLKKDWYFNVLKINNHIIGWVWLNTIENELCNLYINREIRKQGYGKQLIYSIMNLAKNNNVDTIYSEVEEWNEPAHLSFLSCGWRRYVPD